MHTIPPNVHVARAIHYTCAVQRKYDVMRLTAYMVHKLIDPGLGKSELVVKLIVSSVSYCYLVGGMAYHTFVFFFPWVPTVDSPWLIASCSKDDGKSYQ